MVRLAGDVYNLSQNIGDAVELVSLLQSILHVYSDNNIGSHGFHNICRIVVYNAAVH